MGQMIGYARTSTVEQEAGLEAQDPASFRRELLRLVTFAVNAAPTGGALGGVATVTGIAATGAQLAATRGLSTAARGTGATGTSGSGTP